ncbi:MAG: hypothetical protein K2M30_04515 [Desulfovibrionaceae bacterium]|nr:hypothetical protein [Desulfovibrionaceae bacterium]
MATISEVGSMSRSSICSDIIGEQDIIDYRGSESGIPSSRSKKRASILPLDSTNPFTNGSSPLLPQDSTTVRTKTPSTQPSALPNIIRQRLQAALQNEMKTYLSRGIGITLSLEECSISSSLPLSIDLNVQCRVPKSKKSMMDTLLSTVYTKLTSDLMEIVTNDGDVKTHQDQNGEDDKEKLLKDLKSTLNDIVPEDMQQDMFRFHKGILMCSFPLSLKIEPTMREMLIASMSKVLQLHNQHGFFFMADIEEPTEDRNIKIQAKASVPHHSSTESEISIIEE